MAEVTPQREDYNPYCSRCSHHLGKSFHETNEHDEAVAREKLKNDFTAIVKDIDD